MPENSIKRKTKITKKELKRYFRCFTSDKKEIDLFVRNAKNPRRGASGGIFVELPVK